MRLPTPSDQALAVLGGTAGGLGVTLVGIGTDSLVAAGGALLLALYGAVVLWALPTREYARSEIQLLQEEAGAWTDDTFGVNDRPDSAIAHLAKEAEELAASPYDREEYADCLLLLIDAYRKAGGSADDLVRASWQKFEINRSREWGEPDEDGVREHVR